jgi:hypothetical protein
MDTDRRTTARMCAGVGRQDATRWIDAEEVGSTRGGGGGGGSATARSGRRPWPVATIAARAGCDYGGRRGVSTMNGPEFDCPDLDCGLS